MDVFKIDQSLSAGLGSAPAPDTLTPEVSFDAGSEFNLSFFDGPEENSTQGFSDPGSVGSASASPPPGTPASIPVNPSNAALPIVQVPPGIVIKQDSPSTRLSVVVSCRSLLLVDAFTKGYDTNWKGRRAVCDIRDSSGEHNAIRQRRKCNAEPRVHYRFLFQL
ncbi:unnamed protein product, partial [Heterotrigona itama]